MSDLEAGVRPFVRDTVLPQVEAWDRADDLPDAVWRALSHGSISLTGAINPTWLATALLARHGTDAQRERWHPGIARGAVLAARAPTTPC